MIDLLEMHKMFIRAHLSEGGIAADFTMGNGNDTEFLCRTVGESGHVYAFDIQPQAVAQTNALLESEGLRAEVHLDSHENLLQYVSPESVDCVVFNFGRLPGGDPKIMTRAESSLAAIDAALAALRPGGVMAIALYYGGENGYEERDAVLRHLEQLDQRRYTVLECRWSNRRGDPPMPVLVWKEG